MLVFLPRDASAERSEAPTHAL